MIFYKSIKSMSFRYGMTSENTQAELKKIIEIMNKKINSGDNLKSITISGDSCMESYPCQGHSLYAVYNNSKRCLSSSSFMIGYVLKYVFLKYPNVELKSAWPMSHFTGYVHEEDNEWLIKI